MNANKILYGDVDIKSLKLFSGDTREEGGVVRYNSTTGKYEGYDEIESVWTAFDGNTGGTSTINGAINGLSLVNTDVVLGGNLTGDTNINLSGKTLNFLLNEDGFFTNMGSGFDQISVNTIQSDNKILLGGSFTAYNGAMANRLIRLNSDGTIDQDFLTTMGSGFDNYVYSTKIQSDNKILVGGAFTSYSGVTANRLIRLNFDGTIDQEFLANIGSGFNSGFLKQIILQSNNKILLGGSFTTYSGVTANRLIRLNSDGTIDQDFLTNMGSGFNGSVFSIQVQLNNKILVGGGFTTYSGVTANRLIRLNSDGTIDQDFLTNMGSGFNGGVETIKIQTDNKILVGGGFTSYSGVTANRLIRLNSDGTIDQEFLANIGSGFGNYLYSIELQLNDKILVGGLFTSYSGVTANRLIRLNSDGTIDNTPIVNELIFDGKSIEYGCDNNIVYTDNTLVPKKYVDCIRGSYILYDNYNDVNTNNTSETDLYTYAIPANLLVNNGDKIIASYSLISNSADGYINGYFAGNLLASAQVVNTWGNAYVDFKIIIMRISSTSFRYMVSWNCFDSSEVHLENTIDEYSSEDWTINNILKITGTASVGSITAKSAYIEYKVSAIN
jgi:uncharacterized delta-60 repeat protein